MTRCLNIEKYQYVATGHSYEFVYQAGAPCQSPWLTNEEEFQIQITASFTLVNNKAI